MSPAVPSVAVIMRSKNAGHTIGQALAGLMAQVGVDYELLVVDSGSTDDTLDIVRRFPCRVIEIPASAYVPGPVLNMAIGATQAPIVVFQNSDVLPTSQHALARLVAAFDDPQVQATFGRQEVRPEAHGWVRRDYAAAFPTAGAAPDWLPYSLPFAAMRRTAWEEQPFYDAAWGSEDTEWGTRARARGWTVRYVPGATVMHSHNYTLRQLYGRRFIEGEADAFIYGRPLGLVASAGRWVKALARDLWWHLREGPRHEALTVPARRFVYHWSYWRGHAHGVARRRRGDGDVSVGQHAVLSRYD
jgi:rhamnosyltransferase